MTTHVFIVDSRTFKYHLEYLFAGTGAQETRIDFNNCETTQLHPTSENNLVALIADSQRIRRGDLIIFYLQQNPHEGLREGKFFGVFQADQDLAFLDNYSASQYLRNELDKSLTLRTILKPSDVYPQGVSEWEALDEIRNIHAPYQMLWSLIYRKLKGIRGNTMITPYESDRLIKLIRDKNRRKTTSGRAFSFDLVRQCIINIPAQKDYLGRREEVAVVPRLLNKMRSNLAFEAHLQAYIIQSIGRGVSQDLDKLLIGEQVLEWIGNEVSCGVGMQRIDILLLLSDAHRKNLVPIELKAVNATNEIIVQVQRYIDWLEQYYLPNQVADIHPTIIAREYVDKESSEYKRLLRAMKNFNKENDQVEALKYIEYSEDVGRLKFVQVHY